VEGSIGEYYDDYKQAQAVCFSCIPGKQEIQFLGLPVSGWHQKSWVRASSKGFYSSNDLSVVLVPAVSLYFLLWNNPFLR
jgi:hypothetical protein